MKEKLKTIGLTIVIALVLSLILSALTSNVIIKVAVLAVLLVATLVVLLIKFKKAVLPIIIPALISVLLSFFVPSVILWSIVAIIASFIIVEKIPSPYKTVIWMILVTISLTWILPTTDYDMSYGYGLIDEGTKTQLGLFDLFNYGPQSLATCASIIIFIFAIGGFYGLLHKVAAYGNLLDTLAKRAKGKESIVISIIMILIAIFTSISGASMGILIIVPFIISLLLSMGYNKMTAAMVTVGSIAVGVIGNLFSSTFVIDEAGYYILAENGMGVVNYFLDTKATSQVVVKIVILVFGLALLVFNTLKYSNKNKTNKKEKAEETMLASVTTDKKSKIWPLVLIIDLIFVIMILSQISWTSVFGIKFFANITKTIAKFEILGFPIFGKILGNVGAFEQWNLNSITLLLFIASAVISLIYKINIKDYIESVSNGVKKAVKPAVLIFLIYLVKTIITYNPFVITIVKPLVAKFNVFTSTLAMFVENVFNFDLTYSTSKLIPYVVSVITDTKLYSIIGLIWQVMSGFVILVAPTSVILLTILSYLDIPYGKWLKSNWKLLLEILGLILITLTVLILI